MKIKGILFYFLLMLFLISCSSTNNITTNEKRDAMQILEEKRKYYEELDKKKEKEEKEVKDYQVELTAEEEETKMEKETLANMTEDEKLMYKVDKAKAKIDNMLDIAKKARQEEIDVEEARITVEEALKSVTGEAQVE